jgi:hypothetical protein
VFVLDLLVEFRYLVNGDLHKLAPRGLTDAMAYLKLPSIGTEVKEIWRELILTAGPFDQNQRGDILRYCWTDIEALRLLLPAMLEKMPRDLDPALFRSRYTLAVTWSMRSGIPIDESTWRRILSCREGIQQRVTAGCPIYNAAGTFKHDQFERWVDGLSLKPAWPRTETGQLSTSEDTLKRFKYVPEVARLRQIMQLANILDKPGFEVYHGRNYYGLLPYKCESSRNATVHCIFQSPVWVRPLIQAPAGYGLIHADWSQEEFGVAALLSNDATAIRTYETGDSYIAFAAMAGLVPAGATKATHPIERDMCKTMVLALQYGMGPQSLAAKLGRSLNYAQDLLTAHRKAFRRLWSWADNQVWTARWDRKLETLYGWRLIVKPETKVLTCRNFPVQANAAEILRLAHLFLYEHGIQVCAPIHDALLIQAPENELEAVAQVVREQMEKASKIVLHGFRLRAETQTLYHPQRLEDRRGIRVWDYVLKLTERLLSNSWDTPIRPYALTHSPPYPPLCTHSLTSPPTRPYALTHPGPNIKEKSKKKEQTSLRTKPIDGGV